MGKAGAVDGEEWWRLPVAGALGGVVRALTLRLAWAEAAAAVAIGGICATYLTPLAIPLLASALGFDDVATSVERVSAAAFSIGLGGVAFAGLILDVFSAARRKQRGKK